MRYNHQAIEKKWQTKWEDEGIYRAEYPSKQKKYYVLIEFPYPSGERLHVGHARSYSAMDAVARKRRMQGYNVLFPIGWDSFGLPAENYAVKTGIHPAITTKENIANAKKQAKSWGLSFDWSREINTTDPKYYQWTQWIFTRLFKRGLAYRAEIPVNWCPSCKTNLANEEVIKKSEVRSSKSKIKAEINVCERCGTKVSRRTQRQWMLRITAYAERLLADLAQVDYREDIRRQQTEWIGKKQGAKIKFKIKNSKLEIEVFTTRLDTIYGTTALVVAPDKMANAKHLAAEIATKEQHQKVIKYIKKSQNRSELERTELQEKTGVFTGAYAVNPVNGEEVPVWVADYVVGWYGKGAIMLVPAHDERDFAFAKKYGIKIKTVVKPKVESRESKVGGEVFAEDGILVNSGKYSGWRSAAAREKLLADGRKAGWAGGETTYKLRDWVFSRQHYWGEPIPVIYCRKCLEDNGRKSKVKSQKLREGVDYTEIQGTRWAIVPVPEEDLPVKLPHVKRYEPTDTGESPLAAIKEWVKVECPVCGGEARRETDTMPNWAGSSWYYLAYPLADKLGNEKSGRENVNIFARHKHDLAYWLPVDWYNGGLEHTTLHLLYSRFWHKFLFDLGVVPTPEPYAKRTSHGVVLGPDGTKMSKSKGNVISPDEVVGKYGADSFRMYEMFMGPFEAEICWDEQALRGVRRFLERVWRLYKEKSKIESRKSKATAGASGEGETAFEDGQELELSRKLHQTIKKVSEDMEELKFNTAIASLMEYINEVYKFKHRASGVKSQDMEIFLRLLAPFAPHLAEELWQELRGDVLRKSKSAAFESVHLRPWPRHDPALIEDEMTQFVIQIKGKVREKLRVESRKSKVESEMEKLARESKRIDKYLAGKKIKKTIFVPGKLINFVV